MATTLSAATARILDALTFGVTPHAARYVGEKGGAYMQLVVEKIGDNLFSLAHYYTQNGDAMRDPEMIFYRLGGLWLATYFRNDGMGVEQTSLEVIPASHPGGTSSFKANNRMQADHTAFAQTWLRNIKEQHPYFFAPRAPVAPPPPPPVAPSTPVVAAPAAPVAMPAGGGDMASVKATVERVKAMAPTVVRAVRRARAPRAASVDAPIIVESRWGTIHLYA